MRKSFHDFLEERSAFKTFKLIITAHDDGKVYILTYIHCNEAKGAGPWITILLGGISSNESMIFTTSFDLPAIVTWSTTLRKLTIGSRGEKLVDSIDSWGILHTGTIQSSLSQFQIDIDTFHSELMSPYDALSKSYSTSLRSKFLRDCTKMTWHAAALGCKEAVSISTFDRSHLQS